MKRPARKNNRKNPRGKEIASPEDPDNGISTPEIELCPEKDDEVQSIEKISAPKDADWRREWISATSTRNYIMRDPVIDWLKENYSSFVTRNPSYTKTVLDAVEDRRKPNSFTEYIMEQGTVFETHVVRLLSEN